jgi:predicted SprT family Zn-dependent metalloprotease
MDDKVKQQIEARINECMKKGRQLFNARPRLSHIMYTDDTKHSGSAGWNPEDKWYIRLSNPDIETNLDHILNEIVPHEVADVICMWLAVNEKEFGDKGHGKAWKHVAKALGSTGQTIVDRAEDKFIYKTSAGNLVKVNQEQHNMMQTQFKALKDKKGNRITAAGYQPK